MLAETTIFLLAAAVAVPVFQKARLGAVLGYLAAGVVIGPAVLGLIGDVEDVLKFSKIGVVLLLFIIGLELAPARLWTLRHSIFGLGVLQVLLSALPIGAAAWWAGLAWPAVIVVALGLAFSSTAFAIQALSERGELNATHGRGAFAILLFKYLALLPLMAAIPLMHGGVGAIPSHDLMWSVPETVGILAGVVVAGHYLLRPVFRIAAGTETSETFTATALLVVLGTSVIVDQAGLPMAIGAFLAGVLLADSEYRHEIHARVEPFKGLLLGLFFIAVGMSVDLGLVAAHPGVVLGLTAALLATKLTAVYAAGRLAGMTPLSAARLTALLPQAGELAFVLFTTASAYGVVPAATVDVLLAVVTLSMAATPLIIAANERLLVPRLSARGEIPTRAQPGDSAPEPEAVVIGFGRYGQLLGRLLNTAGVRFTALDANPKQVDFVRRYGHRVAFGDACTPGVLTQAGVPRARAVILAINNVDKSVKIAASLRKYHPRVPVYAIARTREHAWRLMDHGVHVTVRSALRPSLDLGTQVLTAFGWDAAAAEDTAERFRSQDERVMLEQYAVHSERGALSPSVTELAHELDNLFECDPDAGESGRPRRRRRTE